MLEKIRTSLNFHGFLLKNQYTNICFLTNEYKKFEELHFKKNKLYDSDLLKKIKTKFNDKKTVDFLCVNLRSDFLNRRLKDNKIEYNYKNFILSSTENFNETTFSYDYNEEQFTLAVILMNHYYEKINKYSTYSKNDIIEICKNIFEEEVQIFDQKIAYCKIFEKYSELFINNVFYEEYINYKIENNTNLERIKTNYIPYLDTEQGYLEFDGIYINKENGDVYLVECKNTFEFKLNDLKEFLGACQIIEKAYGIKTKKIFFTTGERNTKTKEFEKINFNKELYLFDLDDFKKDYSNLKEKLGF